MADYHEFAYKGEPGTCLWSGHKLRRRTHYIHDGEEVPYGYHLTGVEKERQHGGATRRERQVAADKLGDYQDDYFCGLRCAYQFAEQLARLGRRLEAPPRQRTSSRFDGL